MSKFIEFQEIKLDEAINALKTVDITPEQTAILKEIVKILCEFIPIREVELLGFITIGFASYQKEHNIKISNIASFSPEERIRIIGEIFSSSSQKMKIALQNKADIDLIDEGVKLAFQYYKENYAFR